MRRLEYVGTASVRERVAGAPAGARIASRDDLRAWLAEQPPVEGESWATFVVGVDGLLRLAPQRSEHVACAGGEPVLAAGEMAFDREGELTYCSNQSTGYCPPESCWPAVSVALRKLGVQADGFTMTCSFRRCPACGERNLVKDGWFRCGACDAELPREWNFGA
ncbi:MAG: hypothetical protein AAF533_27855 [Acidobacteriota bacterium]